MRQAQDVSLQGERQREALRRDQREYMRRWRANPENRARVVAMHQKQCAERKMRRSRDIGERMCSFCRRHTAVKRIERLITTKAGFKPVYVLCCAECLV
jgi:uncharacterized protein YlaI